METLRQAVAAYEQLIVGQVPQIGYIENVLRYLIFFNPGRFHDAELASEFGYGALGLLGLYHDVVVLRHLRRATTSGEEPKLSKSDWLRVGLTGLQHVELFSEVAAQHHLGPSGKWTTVTVVELLKALFRLGLLKAQGGRMLVHQKVPERAELLTKENQHLFTPEALLKAPKNERDGIKQRRQRQTILRKIPSSTVTHQRDMRAGPAKECHNGEIKNAYVIAGELLYIIRPLAYLAGMYLWGLRSWRAWCCSLAVDLGSYACSSIAAINDTSASNELLRRSVQWLYYLVRSPFYEFLISNCVLRHLVNFLKRLPLLSAILRLAPAYIEAYRQRYFYISGSAA